MLKASDVAQGNNGKLMKKRGLLFLVWLIALSVMGAAYALWSQSLTANNTVATGTYDVTFSSFTAPAPTLGATFSVYQQDSHTCNISLNNLYPTCISTFNFILKDTGTIPAKIIDIKIDGTSIISSGLTRNKDLDGDGKTDITISVAGITANSQIAANNGTLSGTLTITTWAKTQNGNDATANAGGSFIFEIDTTQNP
jgi:predicted ribosomally synthesized peptide with SipW-like signal peptide